MTRIDLDQSAANLRLERDAIHLYEALAQIEKDPGRASAFRTIAANERRHADIWAEKLRDLGAPIPRQAGPRLRVRTIVLLARLFGTHAVRDMVQALEGDEEDLYTAQSSPEVASIAADEREHAEIWRRLSQEDGNGSGAAGSASPAAHREIASQRSIQAQVPAPGIDRATARLAANQIAASERWHRAGRSGTLRAVIFGVSDGLVSNLALVMGASIPVLPYLILRSGAFIPAIILSLAALFAVGAGVSLLTGRSILFSGGRQVVIGAAAAVVTYVVGLAIGVSVA